WACSRRRSAWATTAPARSARSIPTRPCRTCGATWRRWSRGCSWWPSFPGFPPVFFEAGRQVMSRFFGEVRQLGYVVHDIQKEMRHWSEVLGVGPWYYADRVPVKNFLYKGAPSPIQTSVALANSGPLQIELIQQRNDAPSMYKDFLDA